MPSPGADASRQAGHQQAKERCSTTSSLTAMMRNVFFMPGMALYLLVVTRVMSFVDVNVMTT